MARIIHLYSVARPDLDDKAAAGDPYVEPMPLEHWLGHQAELGLICMPSSDDAEAWTIAYLCLASRGRGYATRFAQVKFSDLRPLEPLPVSELLDAMDRPFGVHLRALLDDPGASIPEETWVHARNALVRLRPAASHALDWLESRLMTDLDFELARRLVFQEQKDALGLALSASDLDRSVLERWTPSVDSDDYTSGLSHAPARWIPRADRRDAREDVLVIHDAARVPGWLRDQEPHVGVTQFADGNGHALTVMNVNRHPIEEVTGVDLLYYRHEPDSFVMVQYKRMTRETRPRSAGGGTHLTFRPAADKGLREELDRMRAVEDVGRPAKRRNRSTPPQDTSLFEPTLNYRLHSGACWLKLCHPEAFAPAGSSLVAGMYLPLDYYEQLLTSDATLGPRGGRVINYKNVGRWVNNTLFIEMLSGGWIGSQSVKTNMIARTVERALSARRSVVVADGTTLK